MGNRIRWLACLTLAGLTLGWTGCAVTGGAPPPPPGTSGSVAAFLKDAPADAVMAFRIDVTGATLTGSGSRSAVLSGSVQQMEIRHLELAPSLAFATANASSGDYTTLNLTLSNPQLTLANSQGTVTQVNGSTTPSARLARSQVSVPVAVTVPNEGNMGVMIDFDLQQSVTTDASGNYVIDPVVKVAVINSSSTETELEDAPGTITAILSTPANSLDLRLRGSDKTVRLLTDANTKLSSDIGQFSNLQVGQVIEVDARFQADGTFLAKFIDLGASDQAMRYQGFVTLVRQDAQGNFSFDVVVQN